MRRLSRTNPTPDPFDSDGDDDEPEYSGPNRIVVTVPPRENLDEVVDLLQILGATNGGSYRQFAIESETFTFAQARALMGLARLAHRNRNGEQIFIHVESADRYPPIGVLTNLGTWWGENAHPR